VETIDNVPLALISTARIRNSRQDDDEVAFRRLVESMAREGLINPLSVQRDPFHEGYYVLLAGSRRLRAAAELGWQTIRVSVMECDGEGDAHMVNLVENAARADLSTWELASACQHLHERFGLSQTELASRLGYSDSHVCQLLGYLQLPAPIVEAWRQRHPCLTLPNLQRLKAAGPAAHELFASMLSAYARREGKTRLNAQELLLAQLKADDPEVEQYTPVRRPSHARLNKIRDRLQQTQMPTDPKKVRAMAIGLVDYAKGVTQTVPGLLL
jgi:ParB/RepB/Spo0J family partition protein